MSLFSQRHIINNCSVGKKALKMQGVLRCLKGEVVIRFRLRSDGFIQRVVNPEVGVAYVSCYACEDVVGAVAAWLEVIQMTAVSVGVKVRCQHHVNSVFVEDRHESAPHVLGDSGDALGTFFDAVSQHVAVEKNNLPFLF